MNGFPARIQRDSQQAVDLDASRLLLAFKLPRLYASLSSQLQLAGLILEEDRPDAEVAAVSGYVNHTDRRFWVSTPDGNAIGEAGFDQITRVFGTELEWLGPVYRVAGTYGRDSLHCPLPRTLVLGPGAGPQDERASLESRYPVHLNRERSGRLANHDLYEIDDPALDAYQVRDQMVEQEGYPLSAVLLENMPLLNPLCVIRPNDPLLVNQWNLNRIQAIQAPDSPAAWDFTTGDPSITICIMDAGCDLSHPDLSFVTGTGLAGNRTLSVPGFPTGHGTMCAGVAAAVVNNAIGCAGVAGGCTIMPAAFDNFTDIEAQELIIDVVQIGARVISMSFTSNAWNPAAVEPAIDYAYKSNVIMCAATGNDFAPEIGFPAYHPKVIACGASGISDARASFSNFGNNMSVVAPGVDAEVTTAPDPGGVITTMVQGQGLDGGNYIFDFHGTSAAAPHVAGLAALILSLRPNLSSDDVRMVIESTADKVGPVSYDARRPNGTWNHEMGYGRINALRAMQFTSSLP
jgi:subtilisin family serine protease